MTMHADLRIALIAAVAANGTIGRAGGMPWHLPEDFRYFKQKTMGWPMVMGRRTWQSLPGVLPGRAHVVISSQAQDLALPTGVQCAADWAQALELARPHAVKNAEKNAEQAPTVFVIGGAQIYALALPQATDLYLTEIDAQVDGDTVFPTWDRSAFTEVARQRHHAPMAVGEGVGKDATQDERAPVAFDFVHYRRNPA